MCDNLCHQKLRRKLDHNAPPTTTATIVKIKRWKVFIQIVQKDPPDLTCKLSPTQKSNFCSVVSWCEPADLRPGSAALLYIFNIGHMWPRCTAVLSEWTHTHIWHILCTVTKLQCSSSTVKLLIYYSSQNSSHAVTRAKALRGKRFSLKPMMKARVWTQ